MRIESGPTTERKVRTLLFFLLCAGFAGWFAYDGLYGYPGLNRIEHLEALPVEDRSKAQDAVIYDTVGPEAVEDAGSAATKFGMDAQLKALEKLFGGPPSYQSRDMLYYFGPYSRLEFQIVNGDLRKPNHLEASKKEYDITVQLAFAGVVGVVALIGLVLLVRAVTVRAVVDDDGLSFRGGGPIPWDSMSAIESNQFRKKGWLDLVYTHGGDEKRLRLDEYHLAAFADIVREICNRKGFVDPVEQEKAEKAKAAETNQSS